MNRIILAISLIFSLSIACAVGTQFPFNGVLVDPVKGKALSGTFDLQFAAYLSESGGAPVGASVTITNQKIKKGVYSANLDFGDNVFNGSPVWIEVSYQNAKKPAGFTATNPRIRVATVPYAQVADYATTASYAVESMLASHANTADSATNATNANHASVADSLSAPINAIPGSASAYVTVQVTANPALNGVFLYQAYAAAKALTPNGQPLSATNRASVIVVPGKYYLYAPLTLDAEFVDLIGLTTNRESQHLYGRSDELATATLAQTANNVRIENLLIELPRSVGSVDFDSSDPAAYFPESNLADTVVNNCEFRQGIVSFSMRLAIEYSGRFEKCTADNGSFGTYGTASGTFINCNAGNLSFGFLGVASGKFYNCNAGSNSFGGMHFTSGLFKDCTAGIDSFGFGSIAPSARFYHCIGGGNSFPDIGSTTVIGCVRDGVAYP